MTDLPTYEQLQGEVTALKAQLHCNLFAAYRELDKTGSDNFMASAVIVTITRLSGSRACEPFACADGLEQATIDALKGQIKKTITLHEIARPKELI